ncbi:hypothetical protein [Pseudogracilibacillus auburnensis]|uniref:hypothetical protein n=1 Tax=Pseudogracilibacillus auburnensis TaxID=1494959 RepID=UPI001A979772|nr:hypothetical protein [Pseudogracilibacillus auburnensis]MBO1005640.1 hypothetical protein [Pseudogracilibacillus auburnensis]
MLNTIGSIIIAAFAGAFYFGEDNKVLATGCIILAFLFAVGYFDPDKEHKKSVK